jgi:hypothetical protein
MRLLGTNNRDFIDMGRGIESRHVRCSEYWQPHLKATRDFIRRNTRSAKRVAILGAGRLLDIDLPRLLEQVEQVHLFDADPTCLKTWRSVVAPQDRLRIVSRIEDVTGCMAKWSADLRSAVRRGRLLDHLESLGADSPAWSHEEFDGVISLNIAGQLPLYWRDRVLALKSDLSTEEIDALMRSYECIQTAHFAALKTLNPSWGITVTDSEYYFYEVGRAEWDVEEALYGSSRSLFNSLGRSAARSDRECWLWHLAPQYLESDVEGEIHRVEAVAWRKECEA